MRGVLLGLNPPQDRWCQFVRRRHPRVRVRIESFVPLSGHRHVEVATLRGPGAAQAVQDLEGLDGLESVTHVDQAREALRVRLQIIGCPLARLMRDTGLIPQLPMEVSDEREQWFVHADPDLIELAIAKLQGAGFAVVQHAPEERDAPFPDLTERQEEILDLAVKQGFYAYPRRTSLTALAAQLDISKSTLSECLMVIEDKVMRAQAAQRLNR